jgi:hypothetical protein
MTVSREFAIIRRTLGPVGRYAGNSLPDRSSLDGGGCRPAGPPCMSPYAGLTESTANGRAQTAKDAI